MSNSYRLTKADKLLQILADGRWHSTRELAYRVGHTFAVAKYQLVSQHYCIERQHHPRRRYQYQYRLLDAVSQR